EKAGEHEQEVRRPVARQLRDHPEDDGEDPARQQRQQHDPGDAERRLAVAQLHVAQGEGEPEIAVAPQLGEVERGAARRGADAAERRCHVNAASMKRRRHAAKWRAYAGSIGAPGCTVSVRACSTARAYDCPAMAKPTADQNRTPETPLKTLPKNAMARIATTAAAAPFATASRRTLRSRAMRNSTPSRAKV